MLLTIDIGSKYIHIVQGYSKGDKVKVQQMIELPVPEQGMNDGYIRDIGEMAQVISVGLKGNKMKKYPVVFTMDSNSIISREITVPQVPLKELKGIIEMEMMEYLNLEQEYMIDYLIKGELYSGVDYLQDKETRMYQIEAVAAPVALIQQYIQLAKSAKLKLQAIDYHNNAMTKFIVNCNRVVDYSFIVAEIGNRKLHLHLFNGPKRMFSREIRIDTERYEKNLLDLGLVPHLQTNFSHINLVTDLTVQQTLVMEQLTPYFNEIIEQINRMLQFQLTINAKNPVEHIYLCGGMAQLEGISEYIQSALLLKVEKINSSFEVENEEICPYVNAIGALIRR